MLAVWYAEKEYRKNTERRVNHWLTGECGCLRFRRPPSIVDTEVFMGHPGRSTPFFRDEAGKESHAKRVTTIKCKAICGCFDCGRADIDFWLLPTEDFAETVGRP